MKVNTTWILTLAQMAPHKIWSWPKRIRIIEVVLYTYCHGLWQQVQCFKEREQNFEFLTIMHGHDFRIFDFQPTPLDTQVQHFVLL